MIQPFPPWTKGVRRVVVVALACCLGGACGDDGPPDDEVRSRLLGALRQNGMQTNDAACIADEVDASGHLEDVRDIMVGDADDLPEDADLREAFDALVDAADSCGVESNLGSP